MNKYIYTVLFIIIWWFCFLMYPLWYVPNGEEVRLWLALGLMIAGTILGYAFKVLSTSIPCGSNHFDNDFRFWIILCSGVFCLHIPFLNLPIITGLDMIDHASVPALVASKIIHPLSTYAGFPISYLFTSIFCLFIILIVTSSLFRNSMKLTIQFVLFKSYQRLWIVFIFFVMITSFYVWLIYIYKFPDTFGDLETLFRYQPISKLMLIPAYIIFGIHEWVGRVIQLIFFLGGAFYLYHTTLLFTSKESARFTAMLYLLLPPIFHYGNTHLIEGGSLFFVAAAFFYWIRYFEKRASYDLMAGSFWATMGCLYKHTNVILIPAFALLWVWDLCKKRNAKSVKQYGMEILANSIPAFTFFIYMKLSSFSSDTPSNLSSINVEKVLTNISAVPQGVSYVVFILFAAGSFYIILTRHAFLPYWISWVIPHFLITVMSEAYMNVRQALPYYLGILIAGSLLLDKIIPQSIVKKVLYYGIVPCYLIVTCLFISKVHTPELWGRAMGDRSYINFSNWGDTYVPYHIIIPDLMQRTQTGDKIYAPMGNDSSQFYLAKYNLTDRFYIRSIVANDGSFVVRNIETIKTQCEQEGYDWLLLPRGKWLLQYTDPKVIEPLFNSPPSWLQPVYTYHYGTVEVGLWKIKK